MKNIPNPLVVQALNTLDLLKEYFVEYQKVNNVRSIPLQVIHLYCGNIIKNAKLGRSELTSETELKSFDFLISEIDIMFSVIGGSCIKYCEETGLEDVPEDILDGYLDQMVLKISK